MKRESVFLMVFLIILVTSSSAALEVQRVEASGTVYIRADGSIDPPTAPISTVDNVAYVLTGNITNEVDGIVIERNNVVLDGAGYVLEGIGRGIELSGRSNVTIQNINIKNFLFGFYLIYSSNNSISGNAITNNNNGIELDSSSNNNISGNNVTDNSWNGILVGNSSNNNVSGNTITNNSYSGISLSNSTNNSVIGNQITANSDYGIGLQFSSSYNSIIGNNITANNRYGIWFEYSSDYNNVSGNNITDNVTGIWLYGSSNNRMDENNIADNPGVAIEFREFSNNNSISGNNITNSVVFLESSNSNVSGNTFTDAGVELWGSYANSVENNTVNGRPLIYLEGMADFNIVDAGQVILVRCTGIRVENLDLSRTTVGVELWETNNSIVSGNNITSTGVYPIMLGYSSNNSISGNTLANSSAVGILLWGSSNNSISGNMVIANKDKGIELYESSNYNSVRGNNITDSGIGIWLYSSSNNSIDGNTIANSRWGISFRFTSGNTVCHNNFINNTVQVNDYLEPEQANFWDNGCEGNYWSDYNGTDRDPDGIGDAPVVIDANNVDNYPLMGMFSEFDWVSLAAPEQRIQTICNSTISDLVYNGTAISFNVTGEDGTAGFCRIRIPTILLNVTYKVFVNGTEVTYRLLPFSNETCAYLYFNYTHPTERVMIIPEFPSFLSLPLFFIATLLAALIYRRKHR
jgi:parallel beta-helix repeat protein